MDTVSFGPSIPKTFNISVDKATKKGLRKAQRVALSVYGFAQGYVNVVREQSSQPNLRGSRKDLALRVMDVNAEAATFKQDYLQYHDALSFYGVDKLQVAKYLDELFIMPLKFFYLLATDVVPNMDSYVLAKKFQRSVVGLWPVKKHTRRIKTRLNRIIGNRSVLNFKYSEVESIGHRLVVRDFPKRRNNRRIITSLDKRGFWVNVLSFIYLYLVMLYVFTAIAKDIHYALYYDESSHWWTKVISACRKIFYRFSIYTSFVKILIRNDGAGFRYINLALSHPKNLCYSKI